MGVFFCERELCEFFKSNNKIFDIKYIQINFNSTLENFKLPILGWSESCDVYSYKNYFDNDFDVTTEYIF